MRALTEAWIAAARLRRKVGKPSIEEWQEANRRWIAEHVGGKSFADIGGLLIDGETSFAAEEAGATSVTLFDVGDIEFAPEFSAERKRRLSRVRYVQGDLHDPAAPAQIGVHDIVWCTGVLYHSPNPMQQLLALREITGELLFLGTHTIPEVPGVPQAAFFYPYLDEGTRAALSRPYWPDASGYVGIGVPIDERPLHGYANFWWGITPSALRAMLRTARFEIVEERRTHPSPWQTELVARPIDAEPLVPPVDYFRSRREAYDRGEEPPPWPE